MRKLVLALLCLSFSAYGFSQTFEISADLRARYEFRNGYGTLRPDTINPASFITQRSRIIFDYANDKIKLRFSPQNIRVWGDALTTSKNDLNNGVHEAYGEVNLSKKFSLKIGRQELDYNNARILGNVDWSMQARSHDAIVVGFKIDSFNKVHIGAAYNALAETNFSQPYTLGQYKTLQYLWYNGKYKNYNFSLLSLNNGVAFNNNGKEKIAFSQTTGVVITYKKEKLHWEIAGYAQTGKIKSNTVNAFYAQAAIDYQISNKFNIGLGAEYLSGKSNADTSKVVKSFNPIYGTNHKFNGNMDYFYVGNFINSVGLIDIYANIKYKNKKFYANLTPHYFQSAADVYKGFGVKENPKLGVEIDLNAGYNLYKDFAFEFGYAQMFATNTMQFLKGGSTKNNNWFYITAKFYPKLFSHKVTAKTE